MSVLGGLNEKRFKLVRYNFGNTFYGHISRHYFWRRWFYKMAFITRKLDKQYPIVIAGMVFGKKYVCRACHKPVTGFKDRESAREYKITGLCQNCQDVIFG